jgi:hypothetical protein
MFTLKKVLWWVIFCKRNLVLLLYWQHRKGRGLDFDKFVNFQMTGVWCAFVIPKRQKLSDPESMRGRTGGSLLPLLFFFLSPSTPLSHVSLIFPHLSPTSLHSSTPLSFLPPPVSLHPVPLIYVVMIVVNTIHTFVLLRNGKQVPVLFRDGNSQEPSQ